ncbi:MAG: hypothetical protein M0R80_10110 [Proteobacteria bacterium]|jgi:hypothetical protein|nr:hypothetical protein [Pseudomonadota bacterium]
MTLVDRPRGCSLLALAALFLSCGGGEDEYSGYDSGTDTDTDTDTDADTDTDTDTDTGENETPPDLPALCTVDVFNAETSGDGDGRTPDVELLGASGLIVWSYDPQEDGMPEQWRIQVTPYDPLAPAIAPVEPFASSANALLPAVAARDGAFGLLWLDSRWDTACNPDAPPSCSVEVAFAALDAAGTPAAADPIRLTTSNRAMRGRPAIAKTPDGWLAAFGESDATDAMRLMSATVSAAGVPGTPQIISGDAAISANSSDVALAVSGDVAVAVWRDEDLSTIFAAPMSLAGAPAGEPVVVDQGVDTRFPRIVAGSGGFLVTWVRRTVEDYEVFSHLLTGTGALLGEPNRLTWTISDESFPVPAWSGARYGVLWFGNRANGTLECVDSNCEDQAFASVLDADGAMASVPVLLSNNPNPSSNGDLAFDGSGWTAAFELRRNARQQVYRGRMECE